MGDHIDAVIQEGLYALVTRLDFGAQTYRCGGGHSDGPCPYGHHWLALYPLEVSGYLGVEAWHDEDLVVIDVEVARVPAALPARRVGAVQRLLTGFNQRSLLVCWVMHAYEGERPIWARVAVSANASILQAETARRLKMLDLQDAGGRLRAAIDERRDELVHCVRGAPKRRRIRSAAGGPAPVIRPCGAASTA